MARRRINTRLLTITCTVVLAVGGMALVSVKFLRHQNPQQFINDAEMFAKQDQWDAAAASYGRAAALLPKDANLWETYGLTLRKSGNVGAAASAFQHVTQLDPTRSDAWQNFYECWEIQLEIFARQGEKSRSDLVNASGMVRDTGAKVAELVANDPDITKRAAGRAIIPSLNIRMWLLHMPIPQSADERAVALDKQPTEAQRITSAIAGLTQVLNDDPGSWQSAQLIARAKLQLAGTAQQAGNDDEANTLFDEIARLYDQPLRAQPTNVSMWFDKYRTMTLLSQSDGRPEHRVENQKATRDALDKAQSLVDPNKDLQLYTDVKMQWAGYLASSDPGRSQSILQDVIAKNPSSIPPKIEMARIYQHYGTSRSQGLAILDQIPSVPPVGMDPGRRAAMEPQIYGAGLLRIDILTDLYIVATQSNDVKEQDRLAAEIQRRLDDMAGGHDQDWQFLKEKGRFQLKSKHIRDAIQTLVQADRLHTQAGGQWDLELVMLEADAYQFGQQTGDAISLIEKAMARDFRAGRDPNTHMALARLYMGDHQNAQAQREVAWLMRNLPDDPNVIEMQITLLDPITDKDQIDKLYKQLPEDTLEHSLAKARIAKRIKNDSELERLLKAMHEADPSDLNALRNLASFYVTADRVDEAKALVDGALKAKPGDPQLLLLAQAVSGGTNAEIIEAARRKVEAETNPYLKAMGLADLAKQEMKGEEELQHLQDAEKQSPTDKTVLERIMNWYVAAKQFDKADAYCAKLGAIDADQAHGLDYKLRLALAKGDKANKELAIAIGRQLTNDFKEFSASWEALGEAFQASGQFDSAIAEYRVALDKQATNVRALQNLIACNYQLNKLDDAWRAIEDARTRFPDDPTWRMLEVQHQLQFGDPETVLPSLRDDLKQKGSDQQAYRLLAGALLRAADVKQQQHDADAAKARVSEARDVLQQAVAQWPDELSFTLDLVNTCEKAGDFASAENAINALAARPKWKDRPTPALALADLYRVAGKFDQAEATLRDLLPKTNNNPEVQVRLATVLMLQKKDADALVVLEANKTLPVIQKARVELLMKMGRNDQAETEVSDAARAAPANVELANMLIYVKLHEGKFAEARQLATQALATERNDLTAYLFRAQASMGLPIPDLDAAIADLTVVRDSAPDNTEARLALAECYSRKNDPDSGIRELETALRTNPASKAIRARLCDLYTQSKPPRWLDAEQVLSDGLAMPQMKNDADLLVRQANMWARRGDGDKALQSIRAAMAQVPDRSILIHDYLDILLTCQNYSLLMSESDPLVAGAQCPWWVFDCRARAKSRSGDKDGAVKEFTTALDKAGAENSRLPADTVAQNIGSELGVDKALELVAPRTQTSVMWKLVAIPLYAIKNDHATAVNLGEAAMTQLNTLSSDQQDELLRIVGSLYVTSDPPDVDKAVAIYEQILQRHPNDYLSMNNLACILAEDPKSPNLDKALEYAQRAFDTSQKTGNVEPLVYDTKAWVLILRHDPDSGIDLLHQIIDKANFPDAHYHLAMGYLQKNMAEAAGDEVQAGLDMIDRDKAANQRVDPVLARKLKDAGDKANKMKADKSQAKASP